MTTSIFFAQFLGLYLLILGASVLIRYNRYPSILREFFDNPALSLLTALLALIFGLLIVLLHNVWGWNWNLPITLIGYLAILNGIVRLWFPDFAKRMLYQHIGTRFVLTIAIVWMLLGVYFTHHGFLAHH